MLKIETSTSNAAFQDDIRDGLVHTLKFFSGCIWPRFVLTAACGLLRDSNCNTVGRWEYTP